MRRYQLTVNNNEYEIDIEEISATEFQVLIDGQTVDVTSVEFDVLRALLESAGHPVARATLVEQVLERPFNPFDRSIDVQIGRLRKKLDDDPQQPRIIKAVRGLGYQFIAEVSRLHRPGAKRG